jgi:osmoprotectant transport system substrate-binding protein
MRTRRTIAALVAVAATGTLTSGCLGLGTAGGFVPTGKLSGPVADVKPLTGADISVGSKNFSENILLGKMAIILMQSDGAKVNDLTNIPGSSSARQAMLNNQVQGMWEYTGTGWIAYLGHDKPIPDSTKQYDAVRDEDQKKNRLTWLQPAPMNNTYGFAVTQKVAKKYHITKLSQLKDVPKAERTFCVESELLNRPDGMPGMLKTYGIPQGSETPTNQLKTFQTGAVYDATAKGACNFGEVFTTDGRIVALKLKVLQDDKSYFPKYNVSFVLQDATLKKYPQLKDLFAPVSAKLTNKVLLKLNAQIDVDGEEPATVAFRWLKQEGFVKDQ